MTELSILDDLNALAYDLVAASNPEVQALFNEVDASPTDIPWRAPAAVLAGLSLETMRLLATDPSTSARAARLIIRRGSQR